MNYTGEQWDFPNAWPPLQSFLVKGLHQTSVKEAVDFANTLATRWLRSNYIGYEEYGKMFEKVGPFLRSTDPIHSRIPLHCSGGAEEPGRSRFLLRNGDSCISHTHTRNVPEPLSLPLMVNNIHAIRPKESHTTICGTRPKRCYEDYIANCK